jgi:trans-2,3-dihydro-3-hydroxyanthranilate isomerase
VFRNGDACAVRAATDVCLAPTLVLGSDLRMRLPYRILNVFTVDGDRLSGNPLCVFEDGSRLSTEQMQALARQLNLSETTFILPSAKATAHVRIFTPSFEMPFAGHPTLGTAHVVRSLRNAGDSIVLEEQAGLVPVTADGDRWTLRAAKPPATAKPSATRAQIAAMLGLSESAIAGDPLWVNTGSEQLVIPLASADDVRRAAPNAELVAQHGYQPGGREAMAYVWAREAGNELVVRFFFTQHGAIVEDPATGSACANLGGFFIATNAALPLTATLRQGEAVKRPSHLGLRIDADRGIYVSGNVVELGAGSFDV